MYKAGLGLGPAIRRNRLPLRVLGYVATFSSPVCYQTLSEDQGSRCGHETREGDRERLTSAAYAMDQELWCKSCCQDIGGLSAIFLIFSAEVMPRNRYAWPKGERDSHFSRLCTSMVYAHNKQCVGNFYIASLTVLGNGIG